MKNILFTLCIITVAFTSNAQEKTRNKSGAQSFLAYINTTTFTYKDELKNLAYIKGGAFIANQYEGSDSLSINAPVKVDVKPFFISKYEVSNKEYREFVGYVRDSIAHKLLHQYKKYNGIIAIDWTKPIDWKSKSLDSLMFQGDDMIFDRREIDWRKIVYRFNGGALVAVYPDTLCWLSDFPGSYNEPMAKNYFSQPGFSDFPVIGINYKQALAYCDWKTTRWNNALKASGETVHSFTVRLPSAYEWEAAAQLNDNSLLEKTDIFDRHKPDTLSSGYDKALTGRNKGYRYNFGMIKDENDYIIKSYGDDGAFNTAPCRSYPPNKNGVYNMSGNVAEWTGDSGAIVADTINKRHISYFKPGRPLSPIAQLPAKQMVRYFSALQIVKGGSWDSNPFYLQPGVNEYFKPESTHSYIGFRIAVTIN